MKMTLRLNSLFSQQKSVVTIKGKAQVKEILLTMAPVHHACLCQNAQN